MDSWDDLRFLVALSKTGSMTGAARLLKTSVATVSRRLDRLAETLGSEPFVKTADGWQPSEAAKGLIDLATDFEGYLTRELNSRGEAEMDTGRVRIRIGCLPVVSQYVLIPGLLGRGSAANRLRYEFTDRIFEEGLGDNDIVVRVGPPTGGRLLTRKVGELEFGFYVSEDAPAGPDWVGLGEAHDGNSLMQAGHERFGRDPLIRVDTIMMLAQLMQASKLPGPLPRIVARTYGGFRRLPDADSLTAEYWVMYHESRRGDPAIEETVAWIDACFAAVNSAETRRIA